MSVSALGCPAFPQHAPTMRSSSSPFPLLALLTLSACGAAPGNVQPVDGRAAPGASATPQPGSALEEEGGPESQGSADPESSLAQGEVEEVNAAAQGASGESTAPAALPEATPSQPEPASTPAAVESEATAGSRELPAGVQFIPWEDFRPEGDDGADALSAPIDVRSVTSGARDEPGEDLILAVATESGDNDVIAVDLTARTLRRYALDFACGDCQVSSGAYGTAVLTATTVYGTTDGGYQYFPILQDDFSERSTSHLRVVDTRVLARGESGWFQSDLAPGQPVVGPLWTGRTMASVDHDSGLEVTGRYIRRHTQDGVFSVTDVCATVPDIRFGSAYHYGQVVVVLCDEDTVWVNRAFPHDPFQAFDTDAPVVWVSDSVVATQSAWYGASFGLFGMRVAEQAPLVEGEQVYGHVPAYGAAYRVTSHGVAISEIPIVERR